MTDEELISLNRQGFFPGPNEAEEPFLRRIAQVKSASSEREGIPPSHWDWVRLHLRELFDFEPHCLPAFYSNRSLMPWQAAASWIEGGRIAAVQLRNSLQSGQFLKIYDRGEILAHEAVHAARSAFPEDRWEEFFAYMTSDSHWRRALGPIVRRPWEVWPFVLSCLAGPFFTPAFLGAGIWAAIGFWRLIRGHKTMKAAAAHLLEQVGNPKSARAILVRLTEEEIRNLSKGGPVGDESLRWRLIRLIYWREHGTKNCR